MPDDEIKELLFELIDFSMERQRQSKQMIEKLKEISEQYEKL